MLTEMKLAGLLLICHGTNGVIGSRFRPILRVLPFPPAAAGTVAADVIAEPLAAGADVAAVALVGPPAAFGVSVVVLLPPQAARIALPAVSATPARNRRRLTGLLAGMTAASISVVSTFVLISLPSLLDNNSRSSRTGNHMQTRAFRDAGDSGLETVEALTNLLNTRAEAYPNMAFTLSPKLESRRY
jgi:hypothetical protein